MQAPAVVLADARPRGSHPLQPLPNAVNALALLLFALPLASSADVLTIPGEVHDALVVPGAGGGLQIHLVRTHKGRRQLLPVGGDKAQATPITVPAEVVAVDACAPFGLVLQDARGLTDTAGKRLLEGRPLLARPDPNALFVADLCSAGELRLPVAGGLLVRSVDGHTERLSFAHRARAYSGAVHRGLRPQRPYGMALSLYAPRQLDVDVNGDGRPDLVLIHESRIKTFVRLANGRLDPRGTERDFNRDLAAYGDDVRMLVGDADGDGRAELIIGVSAGAVPERSAALRVRSGARAFDGKIEELWSKGGLVAPLAASPGGLVVGFVDTSMVALGAALLTGEVPLAVYRGDGPELPLTAVVDVRRGRMAGSLPVVEVNLVGDSRPDLVDLGLPGRVAIHPATARGFAEDPSTEHRVPAFIHVVALPQTGRLVLIGEPGFARDRRGPLFKRTQVTLLDGKDRRASRGRFRR